IYRRGGTVTIKLTEWERERDIIKPLRLEGLVGIHLVPSMEVRLVFEQIPGLRYRLTIHAGAKYTLEAPYP
ncbi:MAG: hypothetical protein Q8O75_01065, partial [bacterium]|nr:hypothetical protein [bacterium]